MRDMYTRNHVPAESVRSERSLHGIQPAAADDDSTAPTAPLLRAHRLSPAASASDNSSTVPDDAESAAADAAAFVARAAGETRPRLPPAQAALAPLFRALGYGVATAPQLVLLASIAAAALCTLGLVYVNVETEPLKLWVPPGSRAARDKAAYDAQFGPFYRIEQLVLSTRRNASGARPPILTHDNLELVRPPPHTLANSLQLRAVCGGCGWLRVLRPGINSGSAAAACAGVRHPRRCGGRGVYDVRRPQRDAGWRVLQALWRRVRHRERGAVLAARPRRVRSGPHVGAAVLEPLVDVVPVRRALSAFSLRGLALLVPLCRGRNVPHQYSEKSHAPSQTRLMPAHE